MTDGRTPEDYSGETQAGAYGSEFSTSGPSNSGYGSSDYSSLPDYHYFGPFGSAPESSDQTRPGFADAEQSRIDFPPPVGIPPSPASPPAFRPPAVRLGRVLVLVALVAALIGGAAGFGGAKIGALTSPDTTGIPSANPSSRIDPTSAPSASKTAPATPPPAMDVVEVAKIVLPSTVMIRAGEASGSGFVLDTEGRIMTNNHVVAKATSDTVTVVFNDGSRAEARILGRSPSYDLAVIKVDASDDLVPMKIGSSANAQVGQSVIAVGAPLGLPGSVTEGIVSAKDRAVSVGGNTAGDTPAYLNAVQTDAPINPGNSGGPLINSSAEVIGVNSAILTLGATEEQQTGSIGLGFAIQIDQAMEIGQMLIKDGKATYPVIGANVESTKEEDGARLAAVEPGGPAAKAGLKVGDVVTAIDGRPTLGVDQLVVTIRTHRPGDQVTVTYTRDRSDREATVTLGSKEG